MSKALRKIAIAGSILLLIAASILFLKIPMRDSLPNGFETNRIGDQLEVIGPSLDLSIPVDVLSFNYSRGILIAIVRDDSSEVTTCRVYRYDANIRKMEFEDLKKKPRLKEITSNPKLNRAASKCLSFA